MSLRKATIANVKWSFIESASIKVINFVLTIILARLLTPSDFGVLAIVNVFYLLTVSFIDAGLKEALIQKDGATNEDYASVFWMNLVMAGVFYLILFIAAPYISSFYGFENLTLYIRIQGICLFIDSLAIVQIAKSTKALRLKEITTSRIPASLISFAVGVCIAFLGFGVLSLIYQQIIYSVVYVTLLWSKIGYRPSFTINFNRLKPLYGFGLKVFFAAYLNRIFVQSMNLIYGKFFAPAALGAYSKSNNLYRLPVQLVVEPLTTGLYPTMVKLSFDNESLRKIYRQNVKLVLMVTATISGLIFFQSEFIIITILGDHWLIMKPFLQIMVIAGLVFPISTLNRNILKVKGRAGLFLGLELIRKVISLAAVAVFIPHGFVVTVAGVAATNFLMTFVDMYFAGRLIEFNLLRQIGDFTFIVVPTFFLGLILNYLISFSESISISQAAKFVFFALFFLLFTFISFFITNRSLFTNLFKLVIKSRH